MRRVSRRLTFSYFQALEAPNPLISFKASFRGKKASGTLREKDVIDDGSGTVTYCDSGTLHWHATRS
jgi:hypothetical protein